MDDRTKACTSLKFARALLSSKGHLDNFPDNQSYWQDIEVESKLAYFSRCKVHGHSLDSCRKSRDFKAKNIINAKVDTRDTDHKSMNKTALGKFFLGESSKVVMNIAGPSSRGEKICNGNR